MSITNKLNQIKNAIYGKEVRGAIHDAIKQVYDDASVNHDNANMEVKMARGTHNTLNDRLDNVDEIQAQTNAQLSRLENQVDPFTATLSISKSIAELGSSQDLTLNWSYNRDIKAQKINNDNLDISIRSKSYSNVSTSTTYTLTATSTLDLTTSKSVSITFTNGIYYGTSCSTNYNSDLIKSLTKELSTNKSRTITVNASSGEYIYYCVPTRLGECSFNVNGFEGGFDKVATVSFTNDFNYTENYFIYKSTNSNLGNTTVVVK